MNKGGWLFVLIVGGYLLFEISMLHRLEYRMEVGHILEKMVSAQQAMSRCGNASPTQQNKYARRLATLQSRAVRELAETNPTLDDTQLAALFSSQVDTVKRSAAESITAQGCDSPQVATLMKRYAIYGGKN